MSDHRDNDRWPSGEGSTSGRGTERRAGSLGNGQGNSSRAFPTAQPGRHPDHGEQATTILPRQGAGEAQTDLLPAVEDTELVREPELLTHREPDLGLDDQADAPDDTAAAGAKASMSSEDAAKARKKKIWRRVRRTCYIAAAVCILGPILAFIIAYFTVTVPDPQALMAAQSQTVTIYYADGKEMGKLAPDGGGARTLVTIDQIPKVVQQATAAAEDETFWSNSGFDIKGIGRAILSQLKGNGGGGSGITQQYIKTATGNNQHSITRKFIELVQAVKMSQQQSKDKIMEAYLNTVYYGRGAYGIEAAAKAYFSKDAKDLDPSQAAFLAGCINVPANDEDVKWTTDRWNYTLGRMVANGWLSQSVRATFATPPKPIADNSDASGTPGPERFIERQVFAEAVAKSMDQDFLQRQGAKIYTSIDENAQKQAEDSVHKIMAADKGYPNLAAALVSVDPKTGRIIAWFGGDDPATFSYDMAATPNQPGSSFKPFVFLAGLEKDPKIGVNAIFNGSDHQTIDGQPVNNSDGESCGTRCTVKLAMTQSVNTVFYQMGANVGPSSVRQAALQAGIADTQNELVGDVNKRVPSLTEFDHSSLTATNVEAGISIGQYPVRPRDMANAYATFADNGMYIPSHFITKVTSGNDTVLYDESSDSALQPKQAFDSDSTRNAQLARNVTESMLDVAAHTCGAPGSRCASLSGGRQVASKTGTAQYLDTGRNAQAWMVGYTPQVATAVWVGNRNAPGEIHGNYFNGYGSSKGYDIYGREEPSYIWKNYMDSYLTGKPIETFPAFIDLGGNGDFSGQPAPPSSTAPNDQQNTSATDTTTPETTTPTVTTPPTSTTSCGDPLDPCEPTSTTTRSRPGRGGNG